MDAQTTLPTASSKTVKPPSPYAQAWNDRTPSQRKKLMQDAGYQAYHHWSHRAWQFIPFPIREDVIAVLKRQKSASTPKPAALASESTAQPARKPYWWEEKAEAADEQ